MTDNIGVLAAIRSNLQKLMIPSTRENMDVLLGCIQALDRIIQEAQNNEDATVQTEVE